MSQREIHPDLELLAGESRAGGVVGITEVYHVGDIVISRDFRDEIVGGGHGKILYLAPGSV